MKTSLMLALVFGACMPIAAQQGKARGWERVQTLPSGTNIVVHAKGGGGCKLKSVEADSLTCVGGDGAKLMVFQMADIKAVKIHHRGRSTAVGAGIGAVAGAITGAAPNPGNPNGWFYISRGQAGFIVGVLFAALGALIGVCTDFTQATIYKA